MKKKALFLILLIVVFCACFIPITQQKTIAVNAPFFNTYSLMANPAKWQKWRVDLLKVPLTDSDKIIIVKDTASFTISYKDMKLEVSPRGNSFNVIEHNNNKAIDYSYVIAPGKNLNKTMVTVYKKTNLIGYLFRKYKPVSFADTHFTDIKNFMETDSLRYGCKIFKTGVPDANLIVMSKKVLTADKFKEAAKVLSTLQRYIRLHNIEETQPLIAQFLLKSKDSTLVKIGFFINKEVKSDNAVTFTRMPKGGPLYAARFNGAFFKRQSVYDGLHQYFLDHSHQLALLPFETYLDNKLPVTDTDKVNIQVNFPTYL